MHSLLKPERVFTLVRPGADFSGAVPLVFDSPHSGREFPADFGASLSVERLREAEDRDIDALYSLAPDYGAALLCATFPRTYIDPNRHPGDIDPDLMHEPWPDEFVPSGKARLGKALIWRSHDDGTPIYQRRLSVAEVRHRISHYLRPYQSALAQLIEENRSRHGVSYHINCHSMEAVGGAMGEGGAGKARADFVLGDRDGTTCSAQFTEVVGDFLRARCYQVAVNDPYKGVELVRAFSNPLAGRHSLQIELNKRLYLDAASQERNALFAQTQETVTALIKHLAQFASAMAR